MIEKSSVPPLRWIYGTAWKKDDTARLTELAVLTGFRAIDTANQPKHYQEPLVGEALVKLAQRGISRETLFLQSKFTPLDGQDHRVPYDPHAKPASQVEQSFESSLAHLGTDYLDSYLLHGPYSPYGIGPEDWEVWEALERIHRSGRAKCIGVSNVSHDQLRRLCEGAQVAPMVVQNRCYAIRGWDRAVRKYCRENGITYQGFSLLTANPFVLNDPRVRGMAERCGVTPEQVVFRFSQQIGMVPLTGTTDKDHMKQDLAVAHFELSPEEIQSIETIAG